MSIFLQLNDALARTSQELRRHKPKGSVRVPDQQQEEEVEELLKVRKFSAVIITIILIPEFFY